jgi:two-component system chemotaxis response regulator CheY
MANILIVDDSRTSRKILRGMLEAEGHTIVGEATNGQEGFDMYKELAPELVTLDVTMPVMNGIDCLKLIKADDSEAKVVMITAAGQKSMVMEAISSGADEFVSKPFDADKLKSIISKVIG